METDGTARLLRPQVTVSPPGFRHQALVSRDGSECLDTVVAFAEDGIAAGEAVSVGLSTALGRRVGRALGRHPAIGYVDMTEVGRNPGRIIGAMLDFAAAHDGAALRFISEPPWASRSDAERTEAARHEALIEPALARLSATVLCVYDGGRLDPAAISCAEELHPVLLSDGAQRASGRYAGAAVLPPACDRPLPPPPPGPARLSYRDDLRAVRTMVAACAGAAGLAPGRAADLVLAVSEVAANTLRHTSGSGVLEIWHGDAEIVCQVADTGHIADPLAGRRRPPAVPFGQGGLWVVNQVCDLVELRSGPDGTTIRMHMRCPNRRPASTAS